MTRAPRIDTLRNRLAATRELLSMVERELEDLHVLAYERARAASDAKVNGGARDYALDTHGDVKAREAYHRLGDVIVGGPGVVGVCDLLAWAAHDMIRILNVGERTSRNPSQRVTALELAEAIEAQSNRIARGEYTPVRTEEQPGRKKVNRAVADLREAHDRAVVQRDRLRQRLQRRGDDGETRRGWRSEPRDN
jgi:hypothetical protein